MHLPRHFLFKHAMLRYESKMIYLLSIYIFLECDLVKIWFYYYIINGNSYIVHLHCTLKLNKDFQIPTHVLLRFIYINDVFI